MVTISLRLGLGEEDRTQEIYSTNVFLDAWGGALENDVSLF
jgi:hypothetical protein